MVTITYALLLTPYEASLLSNPNNWDEVIAQDFTTHLLFCNDTNRFILNSDNTKIDVADFVSFAKKVICEIGNEIAFRNKIVITEETTEEQLAKYLH